MQFSKWAVKLSYLNTVVKRKWLFQKKRRNTSRFLNGPKWTILEKKVKPCRRLWLDFIFFYNCPGRHRSREIKFRGRICRKGDYMYRSKEFLSSRMTAFCRCIKKNIMSCEQWQLLITRVFWKKNLCVLLRVSKTVCGGKEKTKFFMFCLE